jgi:Spy/CpxP family protein refolding chaperone
MRFPVILATTALLALGGTAVAQPAWHGHGAMELLRGVTLSDAQKAQIKTIEETARAQSKPVMEQEHSVHEQIVAALLGNGSVTAADLAPLVQQEQALRGQLDQHMVDAALQVRGVLTPSQLADASAKHQQLVALHQQEHQVMHDGIQ